MRVCFLGNFQVPYTSENDYLWTMREKLGFEVIPLQEGSAPAKVIEDLASTCDVFLWVHTHGWVTPGKPMREVLETLRARGVISAAYHLDLYMGLRRWTEYASHDYFKVDHFFTVDKLMADWLNEHTPTKGHFLRAGVVERDALLLDRPQTRDVVFVGSSVYHPEWPYRPALIYGLQQQYGDRFEHWGPHGRGQVRGDSLNRLYAESKVVVGDTLCPGFTYPYYTSDRVYEVLGRGGFLIHPYVRGMGEELENGKHLVYYPYGDMPQLYELIDYYLAHPTERETIRVAGHEKVRSEYTYTNRLTEMFAILDKEIAHDQD